MVEVNLVNAPSGDWQALYIDGRCVLQGHVLDAEEVCSALSEHGAIEHGTFVAPTSANRFPKDFDDVRDAEEL